MFLGILFSVFDSYFITSSGLAVELIACLSGLVYCSWLVEDLGAGDVCVDSIDNTSLVYWHRMQSGLPLFNRFPPCIDECSLNMYIWFERIFGCGRVVIIYIFISRRLHTRPLNATSLMNCHCVDLDQFKITTVMVSGEYDTQSHIQWQQ
jgi:hypothetical protein